MDKKHIIRCCDNFELVENYQTFKNGTKHIRMKCKACNKFLGYKQQKLPLDYVLHFGKHKGKRVKDIDREYLQWLHKQNIKTLAENIKVKKT